ncbi:MAG: hypothetical protein M3Q76_02770 [Acidobacteriota bacterium]|nr:hypothetical protein [Acidobacteriota bacterium]
MRNKIELASADTLLSLALIILFFSTGSSAASQDQPSVAKDSVQATAFTFNVYRGNYDVWSWVPRIEYRVNGPVASGSQLYAEFSVPGGAPLKFDCPTEETQPGRWLQTKCGARDIPEDKGSTYTGPVSFAIKMRNELAGTDATLFTGRMKVLKARSNEAGPKAANHFVYYVDQDWNLPIGYVFLTPNDVSGWKKPTLNVAFWARGEYSGSFQPHLFYQGKEVGKMFFEGREVGKPGCDPEVQTGTTLSVADTVPQKATWMRVRCRFFNVLGWDKTGEAPGMFGPLYTLSENPGEYEFKVLWNNRLARSIKFTVGADGKLDDRLAAANKLGSDRAIVPVQIIGEQDGPWDRTAWKADAFYANPLTGFNVP